MRHRDVTDTGLLTEFLYDDGTNDNTVVCAAHGGGIEPGTAEQAIELATNLPQASCWGCMGYDEELNEYDLWHDQMHSTAITAEEYPLLDEIADRGFETVISFHGLGQDKVLVGGDLDPDVKEHVRSRLAEVVTHPVETVSTGQYAGTHPENFVNWLCQEGHGGLQLEQSRRVRDHEGDAVVSVLENLVTEGII